MTTYVLKPRPPFRAFVLAAIISLAGALFVVLASAEHWGAIGVAICVIVLALGIGLLVFALLSMSKMRVFVRLDDSGYTIEGPGLHKTGAWAEVTKVTTQREGAHLTLHHGEVARTHIICPRGVSDPQMQALTADVIARMDADRGYSNA